MTSDREVLEGLRAAPDLDQAVHAVEIGSQVVDAAARALASGGGIDADQVVAYDLAHGAAAIRTARAALDYGSLGTAEATIACAFVADALADLLSRTAGREGAWGTSAGWAEKALGFISTWRDPAVLAALCGTEGERHLDPDFDMVRDSFRRFAEERVRPAAEHVHRANADVPEEIIAG
ncbi:MAG: acyl-CoA dehydrogenase family protein, partial [Acidimicrobiales bacterium]